MRGLIKLNITLLIKIDNVQSITNDPSYLWMEGYGYFEDTVPSNYLYIHASANLRCSALM